MDNNILSRNNLSGLIPEPITREIIQGAVEQSAVLKMGRRLPNMSSRTQTLNVLDSLPTAYFVNGDTGTKQLTQMAWDKKKIYAEEIAVIVPIPEAVLDDADYDIWGEVKPRLQEAFGKVIDSAILFGTNKPSSWRESVLQTAQRAGNVVHPTANTTIFADVMGVNGLIAKVEEDGYVPDGVMAAVTARAKLRGVVDSTGQPLFKADFQGTTQYALDGMRMEFPRNGAFDSSVATMIVGDWTQLVYAIRQDIEFKVFTEGVVQNPADGSILYNLMQNDMVALRAVMRLGWEIPNPINAFNAGIENPCPFAVYSPDAAISLSASTLTVTKGSSGTLTISDANGTVTAKIYDSDDVEVTSKVTATVSGTTLTVAATSTATAGSYKVVVTDETFESASAAVTVENAVG